MSFNVHWLDGLPPAIQARVTGCLRWRGIELGVALDGLAGLDGRLDEAHFAQVPGQLQTLMLQHAVAHLMRELSGGPLAELTLERLEWHEMPRPMQGDWALSLRREGAAGMCLGMLMAPDAEARNALANWVAAQAWPLPKDLSNVPGVLRIGRFQLDPSELAELAVGDWVWLDEAELTPQGLRAEFVPTSGDTAGCSAWIKRSELRRDSLAPVEPARPDPAQHEAPFLSVQSPSLQVARSWIQGATAPQRLPARATALPWLLQRGDWLVAEAKLNVVGRRIGLRIQSVQGSALTTDPDPESVN
jgi:hypothetical protein